METRYRGQVLSLAMLNTGVTFETKNKYWQWFETVLLRPIQEEQRELYSEIVTQVQSTIFDTVAKRGGHATDGS